MAFTYDYERDRDSLLVQFSHEVWAGMVGKEFDFYGAAEHQVKLSNGVWEAIEDPDDGYRSHLGFIALRPESQSIFFDKPIARVKLTYTETLKLSEYSEPAHAYVFTDIVDEHRWLVVGTNNTDDYYPYFVFEYTPRGEK